MIRKLPFALLLIITSFFGVQAQSNLGIGQLALVGLDTDGDDFTFVLLDNIQGGTQIYFTDNETATDSTLNSGEGIVLWTAPGNLSCGTVIRYTANIADFSSIQGSFAPGNNGDEVIAFQGWNSSTRVVDTFLHAISSNGALSPLPKGWSPSNYVLVTLDNGEYIGNKVDTDANLFSSINTVTPANWFEDNSFGAITLTDTNFSVTNCVMPGGSPTVQASNIIQSSCLPQQNSMTISWTSGDGLNRIVVMKKNFNITGVPANNTTYTADAQFNNGQSTLNAGEFVVYNGNGSEVTVTGLSAGTFYDVQVFEYNGAPGSEDYLTSTATNNPLFTLTGSRPNLLPAVQSFDAAGNSWPYCTYPLTTYNSGGDVFDVVSSLGPISGPASGTDFFGMQDIDNNINGLPSSGDDHYLTFQPVDVSAYPSKRVKFKYWYDLGNASSTDRMWYNIQYDTGTMWPAINEVDLHTPGAGTISTGGWDSIIIAVPANANFVRLRIGGTINGGSDYYAFDDVRLEIFSGPPSVSSVTLVNPTTIAVAFNTAVNATGTNTANYTGLPVGISGITLNGPATTATLNLAAPLPPGTHPVIVNNVQNLGGTPMTGPDTGYVEIVPNILITEIMYNPSGSDNLEFFEIFNAEPVPVNLAGYTVTQGVDYTFPNTAASIIPPFSHQIIANSFGTFIGTFGFPPNHQWTSGALTNGGEDIEITSLLGSQVAYVDYEDDGLWPSTADGYGPSLIYCNAFYAAGNNNNPAEWSVSDSFITNTYDVNNYVFASPGSAECTNNWLGTVDSNFNNDANWSLGVHPTLCIGDVVIGSSFLLDNGVYFYPVVPADSIVECAKFTMLPNAMITVGPNPGDTGILDVCGDFYNYGMADMGWGALNFLGPFNWEAHGPMTIGAMNCGVPAGFQVDLASDFVGNYRYGIGFGPNSGDFVIDPAASVKLLSDAAGNTAWVDDFTFSPTTGNIIGDVTIQRYVANPGNGFHYLGSMVSSANASEWADNFSIASTGATGGHLSHVIPLSNCDPNALDANSPYGGLFDYLESAVTTCNLEGWRVISDPTHNLVPGVGYAGIIANGTTVDIVGNPNTAKIAPITVPITFSASNATISQGYNLVANPFPSGLNWAIAGTVGNNPDIDGSAWIWESTGYYGGSLKEVNVMLPGIIASGQAFEVAADGASGVMNFHNSMRAQTSGAFVRQAPLYEARIDLIVEGNNHADKTHILFADEATAAYDRGYDTYNKLNDDGVPTIYSNLGQTELGIQSLPMFTGMESIEVGFVPQGNGTFVIKAEELSTLPATTLVFIEDKQTGTVHCLTAQGDYSFTANVNDASNRFRLFFNPPVEASSIKGSCAGGDAVLNFDLGTATWDSWELIDDQGNVAASGVQANGPVSVNSLYAGNYDLLLTYAGHSIRKPVEVLGSEVVDAQVLSSHQQAEVGEIINITANVTGANWFEVDLGDGTFVSANAIDYTYSQPGIYQVRLEASSNECADSDITTIVVSAKTTGVVDLTDRAVKVISAENSIFVRFEQASDESVSLTLFDLAGNQMMSKSGILSNTQMNLHLASGIYLLNVQHGADNWTQKVLVK